MFQAGAQYEQRPVLAWAWQLLQTKKASAAGVQRVREGVVQDEAGR